jgi:hypothetical protein
LGDEDGTDSGVSEKGDGLGRDRRAKNTVAVYSRRLALPKPGFVAIAAF